MKEEKIQKLVEKYPYMFKEMKKSIEVKQKHELISNKSIKCKNDKILQKFLKDITEEIGSYYPIAFGFECDDGWFDLIDELMSEIEKIDKNKIANICQVKEKYGGLNFRLHSSTDEIYQIIRKYENKSYYVCEVCGKEAVPCKAGSWYKTVCKDHRELETWAGIKQKYVPVKNEITE